MNKEASLLGWTLACLSWILLVVCGLLYRSTDGPGLSLPFNVAWLAFLVLRGCLPAGAGAGGSRRGLAGFVSMIVIMLFATTVLIVVLPRLPDEIRGIGMLILFGCLLLGSIAADLRSFRGAASPRHR